jgi:Na+/H+ antiporter NhaD/arsenite permease-like protein
MMLAAAENDGGGMPYTTLAWGLPFIGLLLTIAVAPLAVPGIWGRHYGKLVGFWAASYVACDFLHEGTGATGRRLLEMALNTYLPFVLLLGALFVITGGLRIRGAPHGTPGVNTALLAISTAASSCIGTPGTSMLMLRPLLRANRRRARAGHIYVFYIFLVCNIGGALTPLGNPPLFLGYLRGVPFFWPVVHLFVPTVTVAALVLAVFYAVDRHFYRRHSKSGETLAEIEKLSVAGRVNLLLLLGAAFAMMLRSWWSLHGALELFGVRWSFDDILADALFLVLATLSLLLTHPATRQENEFVWTPIMEVAILFAAIFVTLIPVDAIMAMGESGPGHALFSAMFASGVPVVPLFYLLPGALSSVLDNAPAYLVFFGLAGDDAKLLTGPLAPALAAISAGASYFGAMTYIGNAPNLMVKSIVESYGVRMPNFFGYMAWSCLCLLPLLLAAMVVFFR